MQKTIIVILVGMVSAGTLLAQRPAYGILVDNTGSMRVQFDQELVLANEIVTQLKAESSIALARFDTGGPGKTAKMQVVTTCNTDRLMVKKSISDLYVVGGQTTLINALQSLGDMLNAKSDICGDYSERNIVLISDGEDRASSVKPDDLIKSLKSTGTRVYAVGLVDDLEDDGGMLGRSSKQKSKDFLEKLTRETGGKVVFPKKKKKAEDIVRDLFMTETRFTK